MPTVRGQRNGGLSKVIRRMKMGSASEQQFPYRTVTFDCRKHQQCPRKSVSQIRVEATVESVP